jgi:hypothetical protein
MLYHFLCQTVFGAISMKFSAKFSCETRFDCQKLTVLLDFLLDFNCENLYILFCLAENLQKMVRLNENWLTEGLIDFEYKKYIFLSYLSHVQNQFSDKKLYPVLSDMHNHYHNLSAYRMGKEKIKKMFPREVAGIDPKRYAFVFKEQIRDADLVRELDDIVGYSLQLLNGKLAIGNELLNDILNHITIEPIGISPINKQEGYLLLYFDYAREVNIYRFTISPLKGFQDTNAAVRTSFLARENISIANSLECIKKGLLKANSALPNPATFAAMSKTHIPYQETFLPLAKKLLIEKCAA